MALARRRLGAAAKRKPAPSVAIASWLWHQPSSSEWAPRSWVGARLRSHVVQLAGGPGRYAGDSWRCSTRAVFYRQHGDSQRYPHRRDTCWRERPASCKTKHDAASQAPPAPERLHGGVCAERVCIPACRICTLGQLSVSTVHGRLRGLFRLPGRLADCPLVGTTTTTTTTTATTERRWVQCHGRHPLPAAATITTTTTTTFTTTAMYVLALLADLTGTSHLQHDARCSQHRARRSNGR
jgi:hypothetical protein